MLAFLGYPLSYSDLCGFRQTVLLVLPPIVFLNISACFPLFSCLFSAKKHLMLMK